MRSYRYLVVVLMLPLLMLGFIVIQAESTSIDPLNAYPSIAYWIDLWNGQADPDRFSDFLTSSYQNYDAVTGHSSGGPGLVYGDVPDLRQRYPDLSLRIYEVMAQDDTVVLRYLGHLTREGQRIVYSGMLLFRLEDAKINRTWHLYEACMLAEAFCVEKPTSG